GVPEDDETEGKPRRSSKLHYDSPCAKDDCPCHDQPQDQATDAHLQDERPEAAFHAEPDRRRLEKAHDVLRAQRAGTDAIAVGPSRTVKGAKKILDGIVPGAGA